MKRIFLSFSLSRAVSEVFDFSRGVIGLLNEEEEFFFKRFFFSSLGSRGERELEQVFRSSFQLVFCRLTGDWPGVSKSLASSNLNLTLFLLRNPHQRASFVR